jgi:peptide/nickel transport system ATP-binding protein
VRSIAQDVIVLQSGRVVETGSVEEVLSRPKHPYTQQLLADLPRIADSAAATA